VDRQPVGHSSPATARQPRGGPYDGSWSELNAYIPILVLGAIATAFAVGSVVIASLAGPSRYNRSKLEAYECGIEPTDDTAHTTAGQRFPIKYYLTAMLFIVFDIEIVFLYPWAVSYDALGTFALVEMVVFMLTVFVAYAYVWRRGGLTWD
jgi:NADH-quinone oxidoreductase subunit A